MYLMPVIRDNRLRFRRQSSVEVGDGVVQSGNDSQPILGRDCGCDDVAMPQVEGPEPLRIPQILAGGFHERGVDLLELALIGEIRDSRKDQLLPSGASHGLGIGWYRRDHADHVGQELAGGEFLELAGRLGGGKCRGGNADDEQDSENALHGVGMLLSMVGKLLGNIIL